MNYLESKKLDKSHLEEDGEWINEPDYLMWIDEDTGYKCEIKRHPQLGHLCGYVYT